MTLAKALLTRVVELGGSHGGVGLDFESAVRALAFPHPLIVKKSLHDNLSAEQASAWLQLPDHSLFERPPVPALHFRTFDDKLFRPFNPRSTDFGSWGELSEEYFRSVIDAPTMEFVEVAYVDGGYPDLMYICTSDRSPENPTLYGTDHEDSWSTISNEGSLLDLCREALKLTELRTELAAIALA